ncbi:MAG: thiopurine S-methyltransferase [Steroidobacteraceae bacterium]|nr:thiopurine S-methyltransferase [Nevskiaceae bacterium]MCP5339363.1 thiopurine S-methyltransferase [Nevskiaceae bacterium]MCP5466546.1 thiopurine S-methyltransferase [Nevskiaceae bacterium]MCP5471356.1 thiopurine S-methyltransferase [Nevskiaceae bacterium]
MQADYWHQRWANQDTPFHERDTNPLLLKHLASLSLPLGARLFLPLCGKTLDIRWLLSLGYRVAGAELSPLAIEQLFTGLGIEPEITPKGPIAHYHAPDLDLFVGDIFDLTRTMLGPIDAIYDRAALVALPAEMRTRYTRHLLQLADAAPQLLLTMEYDQRLTPGPPFSVDGEEIRRHYQDRHEVSLVHSAALPGGGLKGRYPATERAWLLRRR